ncbi:MAG: hypothetical protein AAFQ05_02835 [Pseudomonadota bacterium]
MSHFELLAADCAEFTALATSVEGNDFAQVALEAAAMAIMHDIVNAGIEHGFDDMAHKQRPYIDVIRGVQAVADTAADVIADGREGVALGALEVLAQTAFSTINK